MKFFIILLLLSSLLILTHQQFLGQNADTSSSSSLPLSVDATAYILSYFKNTPTLQLQYTSGYLPINGPIEVYPNYNVYTTDATGKNSKMYYMLVSANGSKIQSPSLQDQQKPLILWLQGGPGCGGLFAFSTEMGPFRAFKNSSGGVQFQENIYTWSEFSYMLFIDQPIGVGLSPIIGNESGQVINTNSTEIAMAVVDSVLEQFFTVYPQLKSNPFYIFGESYAGHYAPSLTSRILKKQSQGQDAFINLKGMGIGDGWTDPLLQNQAYAPYLYSAGVISSYRVDYYKKVGGQIAEYILTGQLKEANTLAYLFDGSTGPNGEITLTQTNDLNYREYFQDYPSQDNFQTWIGLSQTISKLQFDSYMANNFQFCSNDIYFDFSWTASHSFVQNYSIILQNLPVLIYEGQVDPDVSTNGVLSMLQNVQWQGMNQFRRAQKQFLLNDVTGNQVGIFKQYDKLKFVLINNAGHLVPHDQPQVAQQVIKQYFIDQGLSI